MSDTRCPYCKHLTFLERVDHSGVVVDESERIVEAAYQCAHCRRLVIGGARLAGFTDGYIGDHSTDRDLDNALSGNEQYWEPTSPMTKTYEGVPDVIAAPASEAHQCRSVGAHRAAVLMARSVIEATAKSFQIEKGHLIEKIDALRDAGHVRPITAEAAHEVRHLGNDMAHGDFAKTNPDVSDVEDALIIMDQVIDDAFAASSRLDRLTKKRVKSVPQP